MTSTPQPMQVPGLALTLLPIPAGTFIMGSPDDESRRFDHEGPQTRVTISQAFWLGKYAVTHGQYEALMGTNPSHFTDVGKDAPVEQVSWEDAMIFCRKLTKRERVAGRLPTGYIYTLPTEAQWEYACRAGTTGPHAGQSRREIAWYDENSGGSTHPVGTKQPNTWGFYDMHGNVWEWCADWFEYYSGGTETDPTGPASGTTRVARGGGWGSDAVDCRSANRNYDLPSFRDSSLGFRVALEPSADPPVDPDAAPDSASHSVEGLSFTLKPIPAGSFTMGSPADEPGRSDDEGPQTQVSISQAFWLGKYAVTQGQYQSLMGTNPSHFKAAGKDAPVENVSWDNAMAFCQKLTERQRAAGRLPAGYAFTLPTEAQWEYACRAGTVGLYAGTPDTMAWYDRNSGNTTHPVGTQQPNFWGLYDMHGNVWEWCADWYTDKLLGGVVTDPTQLASGINRVRRGGGWNSDPAICRSANRTSSAPGFLRFDLGFRVALVPAAPPPVSHPSLAHNQKIIPPVQPAQTSPVTPAHAPVTSLASISMPRTVLGLDLTLAPIPAGTFIMGSPADEPKRRTNEGPQTRVTISQPFWLGKYAVTQGQYDALMRENPSHFKTVGHSSPVESVSWDDAMVFCQKLTERERAAGRLPSGYAFTLPTEAQWEYACRAGTVGLYAGDLDAMAWYAKNSVHSTHPVGAKQPNAWDLYDMHGNVWQWCFDRYGAYSGGAVTDPSGPISGSARVGRGGSWNYDAAFCRSACRYYDEPVFRDRHLGFRVALSAVR